MRLIGVIVNIVGNSDAERGADPDRRAEDDERPAQDVEHAFRDVFRFDGGVDALDEERELVAAEARGGVGAAQAGADPSGHLDEQGVAGGVSERVVDAFEVVDVEEDHGQARASLRAPPEPVLDLLAEQRAVGEIGERVVVRLVGQLLLQLREPRDRALHAAVLEDDRRPRRQRPEETEVAHVECVRVEVAAHHEAADHPRLAAEQRDHRLVALRDGRASARSDRRRLRRER